MQLSELANKYQEKKIQIVSDIKQLNEKLQQAREQKKRYEQLNITEIEQRVNARESVAGKKGWVGRTVACPDRPFYTYPPEVCFAGRAGEGSIHDIQKYQRDGGDRSATTAL